MWYDAKQAVENERWREPALSICGLEGRLTADSLRVGERVGTSELHRPHPSKRARGSVISQVS